MILKSQLEYFCSKAETSAYAAPVVREVIGKYLQLDKVYQDYKLRYKNYTMKERNMGKVILIASGKGGVGKTVFASNAGAKLAQLGYKVVPNRYEYGTQEP